MGLKFGLASGKVYRGQVIFAHENGATIWPSWLDIPVTLANEAEAEAFIDAREALLEKQNGVVCPWCLENANGPLITINNCLLASDHEQCRAEAVPLCTCCDPVHAGDSRDCPVHNVVADVLFRSCIPCNQSSTVSES